jgi:peptidoglycan/LPS O-acetylase OafA/YrhL
MYYWRQLDGLRTLAVFGVMLHHFLHPNWDRNYDLGLMGVKLFFVLSGFLITGILLRSRGYVEEGRQANAYTLRQFYARRFLRIFPLFYLCLLVMWLLGIPDVREGLYWYLSHLSNFYFASLGWFPESTAHLWSLAVEEQFYLLWPVLILFLPKHWMMPTLLSAIAVGPLFRYFGVVNEMDSAALYTLPFSSMDSLGLGALIAYLDQKSSDSAPWRMLYTLLVTGVMLPAAVWLIVFGLPQNFGTAFNFALPDLVVSLVFGWLVLGAKTGYQNFFGRILAWQPVVFLGRISYGIYVYHLFMPVIFRGFPEWSGIEPLKYNSWMFFLFYAGVTIVVASLSWFLFEAPINRLKRFFPYRSSASMNVNRCEGVLESGSVRSDTEKS